MQKLIFRGLQARLQERCKNRLMRFKELMYSHMKSPKDAFRMVKMLLISSMIKTEMDALNLTSSVRW
jgi:hypothetical protein